MHIRCDKPFVTIQDGGRAEPSFRNGLNRDDFMPPSAEATPYQAILAGALARTSPFLADIG